MPEIEVVRPFNKTPRGDIAEPGELLDVTETRGEELKRLGLARDPLPQVKQAPTPENKMAPVPENKAAPSPLPKRRGRPPKVR